MSAPITLAAPSGNTPTPSEHSSTLTIPPFDTLFPLISLHSTLRGHLTHLSPSTSLHGQSLLHTLSTQSLLQHSPLPPRQKPDFGLRSKLQSNPYITLRDKMTGMTPLILKEIFHVGEELEIGETEAIALYAEASDSRTRRWLEGKIGMKLGTDVPRAARELFFYSQGLLLGILELLIKGRMEVMERNEVMAVMEGTDELLKKGLIPKLIEIIRDLTTRGKLPENGSVSSPAFEGTLFHSPSSAMEEKKKAERLLKTFAIRQRQKAADCLFYLLYHTQGTAEEIGSLVDLIKDLSSEGLPLLDPVKGVPSLHVNTGFSALGQWNAPPPIPKEKSSSEWEEELLHNLYSEGKPQLLQCVNTLILAVMCALDPNHINIDRNTHLPHPYGEGNALLPPPDSNLPPSTSLSQIHSRLDPSSSQSWKRPDIFGLLSASYALLLQPTAHSPLSSRPPTPFDLNTTFHSCLESAPTFKSLSYARTSLLTSFSPSDVNHSFYISTLAEFVSGYINTVSLCGEMPISRDQWYKDEQEELKLRILHEEQRRQFGLMVNKEVLNRTVDIGKRPDCMDDLMALAVDIMTDCPPCAVLFWEESDGKLGFSKALERMEKLQLEDGSLLPSYLAYLAGLSLVKEGSEVVNEYLKQEGEGRKMLNWVFLLNAIRWYADELIEDKSAERRRTSQSGAGTAESSSSAYYYNQLGYAETEESRRKTPKELQPTKKVLGESNTSTLLSLLELLSRIASNSPSAQEYILSMQLPSTTPSMEQDDALTILFSLLTTPISSQIKGCVFQAVASLVQNQTDSSLKVWEILETSQVIPTLLLSQYSTNIDPPTGGYSISLKISPPYITSGENYGILYEMERIESKEGVYPATEGFLTLLAALIKTTGCPTSLGDQWRRPGVSPFVEYVTNFLLPRIIDPKSEKKEGTTTLPFASEADRYRLLTRVLEVISTVLSRYVIPPKHILEETNQITEKHLKETRIYYKEMMQQAKTMGLVPLQDLCLVEEKLSDDEIQSFLRDFREEWISLPMQPPKTTTMDIVRAPETTSVPRPKSPGFAILADILSGGALLKHLLLILVGEDGADGIEEVGHKSRIKLQAMALFGDTQPTFRLLKESTTRHVKIPSSPLYPPTTHPLHDSYITLHNAISWREQSISLSLLILSSSAARNQSFLSAAQSNNLTIVPTLRFTSRPNIPKHYGGLEIQSVTPSSLAKMLIAAAGAAPFHSLRNGEPLVAIAKYVGYTGNEELGKRSVGLISFVCGNVSPNVALPALCGRGEDGEERLAEVFARRLLWKREALGEEEEEEEDGGVKCVILDLLLENARCAPPNLAQILLGFPVIRKKQLSQGLNCLDAILELLSEKHFLSKSQTAPLAAKSYELLYRLSSLKSMRSNRSSFFSKLRQDNFWCNQCLQYLTPDVNTSTPPLFTSICSSQEHHPSMHALAWLHKGIASEIHSLMISSGNLHPQPNQCRKLLSLLFHSVHPDVPSVIQILLSALPLSYTRSMPLNPPPRAAIRASSSPMPGPPEVFRMYQIINTHKLTTHLPTEHHSNAKRWAEDWNFYASWACASSHICHAWETIIAASIVTAPSILVEGSNGILEKGGVIKLVNDVLDRIVEKRLEVGSALPLANAALRLVELFVDLEGGESEAEEVWGVCIRLAKGILACRDGGREHDERAAVLSCALKLLLSRDFGIGYEFLDTKQSVSWGRKTSEPKDVFLNAAMHLSTLAAVSDNIDTAKKEKVIAIALAARAGLTALITFFDSLETKRDNDDVTRHHPNVFLLRLFSGPDGEARLSRLIHLIPTLDADIAWNLQGIACCKYGAELLQRAGAPAALVATASEMEEDVSMEDVSGREMYGSMEIDPPAYFLGHITLLNSMLRAMPQQRLVVDAMKFIRCHVTTGERLLRSYPRNGDLTEKYLTLLSLATNDVSTSTSQTVIVGMSQTPAAGTDNVMETILGKHLPKLEHRVIDLVFHLSTFPFPHKLLPFLPSKLRDMERKHLSQLKRQIAISEKSWWDLLPPTSGINLPNPPSTGYGGGQGDWTDEKYAFAILSAKSLEVALMFLKGRVKADRGLSMDGIAVAKGLCRCGDVARSVENYLKHMEDTTTTNPNQTDPTSQIKKMERDALSTLGPILARCAESLLILAAFHLRSLVRERDTASGRKQSLVMKSLEEFGNPVIVALEHTQMENMGIGCINLDNRQDDSELGRKIARSLREQIQEFSPQTELLSY